MNTIYLIFVPMTLMSLLTWLEKWKTCSNLVTIPNVFSIPPSQTDNSVM